MVVGSNPQTVADLKAYFKQSGLTPSGTRHLEDLLFASPPLDAVVLFPDEFERDEVTTALVSFRRARPRTLLVLVSSAPQHLGAAIEPNERSMAPLVLPKPAFGWTLLDAIRGTPNPAPL